MGLLPRHSPDGHRISSMATAAAAVLASAVMELFHLRYFVAVAQELSFTRAAHRLHMATSPLSQRIKDLERELGCPLFLRGHHKITLTPEAETLLPLAADLIRQFDRLPDAVREGRSGRDRVARIGLAPDVSPRLRNDFVTTLARTNPRIGVEMQPSSSERLRRAVLADEIDIALVHGPVVHRDIRAVRLATQQVGVAVAEGSGFDGRRSVRLTELAHLPYASISYESAPELFRRNEQALVRAGVHGRITVDGDNYAGLAHLVATGQAFTFVGMEYGSTLKAFAGEPVLVLPTEDITLRISTEAIWHDGRDVPGDVVGDLVAVVDAQRERMTSQ